MNLPTVSNSEGVSGGSFTAPTSQLKTADKRTPVSEVKQGINLPTSQQPPNSLPEGPTSQPPSLYIGREGKEAECGGSGKENEIKNLPALRCLGELADVRPIIVIDTREQTPLPFARLTATPGTLTTGDYSIAGSEELFAIERKTVADLVACCVGENRERFFRELHRLRGYRFKRLLVVGTREEIEAGAYRSAITPRAVLATLSVIEVRYDVPVVFAATPDAAGRFVESWAYWSARECVEACNELARAHGLTRRTGRAAA